MAGEQHTIGSGFRGRVWGISTVDPKKNVQAFEVDGIVSPCVERGVGERIVREINVVIAFCEWLKTCKYIVPDVVVCVRDIGARADSDLVGRIASVVAL